jgi:hypothetical protein
MFESLDEIKGVGEKIKGELITYHGSESEAIRALWDQEFEGLVDVGIPLQKASEIARQVTSKKYGFSYSPLLKTKEAKEIFNMVFELLRIYPKTDFGRVNAGLFYPTLDRKEIERRRKFVAECEDLAGSLSKKRMELDSNLAKISSLKEGAAKIDDLIVFEDQELYSYISTRLQKKGNFLQIEAIEDLEYLRDFEFVRYVQRNARFADQALELPNVEPVYDEALEAIAPEVVISFFRENRACILSAVKIAVLSGEQGMLKELQDLRGDLEVIESIGFDGTFKAASDGLDDLKRAGENLDAAIEVGLENANAAISEKIKEMSIRGEDVLSMLATAQTSSLLGSLPRNFHSLISAMAAEYEDAVSTELGIDKVLLRGVFLEETYPLDVDGNRLSELKTHLALELKRHEFASKQRLAMKLSKHIPKLKELVRGAMELDLRLAIGKFCFDHNLVLAGIQKDMGVSFVKGRNLSLEGKVQPIDYVLGSSNLFPKSSARAVVITGANSGGKTTLLELILQVIILSHMGLGVPSESAECSLFEEVYYFGKSKGDDAGAFETLLKTFEGLSDSSKGRIILADEIESITEPGAAAKILAGLLDWFKEDEKTLIAVVTHLGEDIKEHVGSGIRIDGIEATGLDENLNLIVDRNPILGKVAKSTPELIVERLSRISKKSVDKRFYNRILERFKN